MKIDSLHLDNFKNYENLSISFKSPVVSIVGLNGAGKTNILDAIHYLAFTKSNLSITDAQSVRHDEKYFLVKAVFNAKENFEVKCYYDEEQKKVMKIDGEDIIRLSSHIGKIPVVLSSPYDSEIIRGASEVRRKWIDGCISMHNNEYLEALLNYQKVLRQRNSFLKQNEGQLNPSQLTLLDTYDDQIVDASLYLHEHRATFLEKFIPMFSENYQQLTTQKEETTMEYNSRISGDFAASFRKLRKKDIVTQRTNAGAHRDDFTFLIEGHPIKKFGSQGQQKSFLIALKLAQFDYIKSIKKDTPILLLDDVFDKLDDERIHQLTSLLSDKKRFDQVILTDARKERTLDFTKKIKNVQILEIEEGKIASDA